MMNSNKSSGRTTGAHLRSSQSSDSKGGLHLWLHMLQKWVAGTIKSPLRLAVTLALAVTLFWLLSGGLPFCKPAVEVHQRNVLIVMDRDDYELKGGTGGGGVFEMEPPAQVSTVHVVTCTDMTRLDAALALVNSIQRHTSAKVCYHIATTNASLSAVKREFARRLPGVTCLEVAVMRAAWIGDMHAPVRRSLASPLNFARYFLPQLFPALQGRYVYLDDDTLVRADIREFAEHPLRKGHCLAARSDCDAVARDHRQFMNSYGVFFNLDHPLVQKAGISGTECSFNVGVYVSDTRCWARMNASERLVQVSQRNAVEFIFGRDSFGGGASQPPMLLVFFKKITPLDPLWNVKVADVLSEAQAAPQYKELIAQAKLWHWKGETSKPWLDRNKKGKQTIVWKSFIPDPAK